MFDTITSHNTGLAKVAVQCFADTFVVDQTAAANRMGSSYEVQW